MLDAIDARAYADERAKAASSNPGPHRPAGLLRHLTERPRRIRTGAREVSAMWWWFLVLGVMWIWFGMLVLSYRVGSLAAVAAFVGVAVLFGGITQPVARSSWRWARARADRGSAPVADLSGGGAAMELAFAAPPLLVWP